MSTDYTILIEGFLQVLIAIIIFITTMRRGKNRLLSALGWLFLVIGIFGLIAYLPENIKQLPIISIIVANSSIIVNIATFFGIAGYCSFQLGMLRSNRIMQVSFMIGFFIAFLILFINILSLDTAAVDTTAQIMFKQISNWMTYIFFFVSLLFIILIFFTLAWQLRKEKGAMNYITTTGLGLSLMLVAIVMRKVVDAFTLLNHAAVDTISFLSFGLVITGAMFQSSLSMSPGFIYNSKTKKPIELATVRVFRAEDNKLLESRITRKDGHYGLLLEPGEYKIEVDAKGYEFPAKDGTYKGEAFRVHKPLVLAFDIPLDPEEID